MRVISVFLGANSRNCVLQDDIQEVVYGPRLPSHSHVVSGHFWFKSFKSFTVTTDHGEQAMGFGE